MNKFIKNSLSQNNFFWVTTVFALSFNLDYGKAQIINYIANGSFEESYDCAQPFYLTKVKNWLSIDSASFGGGWLSTCGFAVPQYGTDIFQYPKTGNAYILSTFYYYPNNTRGYLKNRLKHSLNAGSVYCVKFHVNIRNVSTYGMDGFGIYFGGSSIDTITKCTIALNYINPQVKNPLGNVISDTLNWVPITGSFVASGNEKYALIGNFLSDESLTTSLLNPMFLPGKFTDVGIDDVSCIDIDLPAFAGLDTFFIPGSSLYLGRERDVGIDEACIWYQLPNMTTALDTAAGIWVTPVGTSTYVVRQEICGNVKWDTVVVRESPLGVEDLRLKEKGLKLWPQPAKEEIQLQLDRYNGDIHLRIFNSLGVVVRDEELVFKENKTIVRIDELAAGSYILELRTKESSYRSKMVVD